MNDKIGNSVAVHQKCWDKILCHEEKNEGGWLILPCYLLMANPHLSVCLSVGQWQHLSDSGVVFRRRFVPIYPQSPDSSGESCPSLPTADRYKHTHTHTPQDLWWWNDWYRLIGMRRRDVSHVCVLACALQFLHEKNISHLDLKPQNILLSGNVLKLAGETLSANITDIQYSYSIVTIDLNTTKNVCNSKGFCK